MQHPRPAWRVFLSVTNMPSNIEIKAILKNRIAAEAIAFRLNGTAPETMHQQDIFFPCEGARLKLRILGPERGELIRYERSNIADARRSRYSIACTTNPEVLRDILTKTLGTIGVVTKTRNLYLVGQTRIHIDQVDGLGDFLELEVVLNPDQSDADGKEIVAKLLSDFGVEKEQLIGEAYVDLLARDPR
jgi:predicted adenylyl cyclase CyaB